MEGTPDTKRNDINRIDNLFNSLKVKNTSLGCKCGIYIQISNAESGTHWWLQFAVFNQRSASSTLSIEVNSYGDWPGIS